MFYPESFEFDEKWLSVAKKMKKFYQLYGHFCVVSKVESEDEMLRWTQLISWWKAQRDE